jgi:NAD(P)-dependent dehydrogenase (short-subunit alcohol dehydrogenase family)
MARFDGRKALVTGAASGIGAATARALAHEGAAVVLADVTDASALAHELGGRAVLLDVADPAAWDVLGDEQFDLGVLNAGVGARFADLSSLDDAIIDAVLAVNVAGVIRGTRELARRMPHGGAITVTGSLAGLAVHTQSPVYGASKWGVVGWVRAIAPALSEASISIDAVCPGLVDTPILGPGGGDRMREMGLQVLDAADVAAAHLDLLASEGTGRVLTVQSGRTPAEHRFANVDGYQG